jgi:hypothetical protein
MLSSIVNCSFLVFFGGLPRFVGGEEALSDERLEPALVADFGEGCEFGGELLEERVAAILTSALNCQICLRKGEKEARFFKGTTYSIE